MRRKSAAYFKPLVLDHLVKTGAWTSLHDLRSAVCNNSWGDMLLTAVRQLEAEGKAEIRGGMVGTFEVRAKA